MDQSYAESDVSLSPSQILDRLQVLRQLQLLQRGKLQKQRLQYQESSDNSSSLTEIVSNFSNSTSYNTFRSILQSSCPTSNEASPCDIPTEFLRKIKEHDLIEGVSALNLSQESEFIANSPLSSKSRVSSKSAKDADPSQSSNSNIQAKKQIALDEMPILQPKQDFETLLVEKLKNDKIEKPKKTKKNNEFPVQTKKPFLKRGEGLARFGVRKNDLVIQNTKSLPWKRKSLETRVVHTPRKLKSNEKDGLQIVISESKPKQFNKMENNPLVSATGCTNKGRLSQEQNDIKEDSNNNSKVHSNDCEMHNVNSIPKQAPKVQPLTGKHPLKVNKGKTWAAVLTKEQDDFLRQLKQSDYYKNYVSPAKSTVSDASCDDYLLKLRQEREMAEQNMFELLENKVTNESFNLNSSFFNKFLKSTMECSGESTPMMMQKCLASNPQLLHIFPWKNNEGNTECSCQYTDCSDASSVSSCSTCKTVEDSSNEAPRETSKEKSKSNPKKKDHKQKDSNKGKNKQEKKNVDESCQDDTVTEADEMKANMAEMNAKLAATGELLKERLRELEDEIDTFRKENISLSKMREEIDLERQKFYEEKSIFEQKFNEEKVLSEYYLAEEKEKLTKQKQMYEKYVREIRGRLNKKEKDEVINLKREIIELKEDIRVKDAKSTTTIARLRNQLKITEKDKINLQEEVEKLKKENRRIQHSNEITRRLTNVKYLEEINKKLTHMSKNSQSEVDLDNDIKYKSYEIERQSRSRKIEPVAKGTIRPRAKSVPNINVTSRYAKYFSQRDALSEIERNENLNIERTDEKSPYNDQRSNNFNLYDTESVEQSNDEGDLEDNNLEKIYTERFRNSPVSNRSRLSNNERQENPDAFFIQKSNLKYRVYTSPIEVGSDRLSASNVNKPKSPITVMSNRSRFRKSPTKDPALNYSGESGSSANSRSPVSILTNHSSSSQRLATVINQEQYRDTLMNVSPEPSTSKTSINKTTLNPTEIKKPDGSKELRFPNGNIKYISADGKYSKFVYYNGDVKENFYNEGRIKYYYTESKTYHTTHPDGLEVLEFPDGQVEKRYKDGSTEIRLPNGSVRYQDPKNEHVREEWRFPDGTSLTVSAAGEQRIVFSNGQVEVHAKDHKRREFPDGTVKLVYNDGTSETRYASGRVRVKDQHGNLIMDSAPG